MAAQGRLATLLAAAVCLGGCSLFRPAPIIEARFKPAQDAQAPAPPPRVSIAVSSSAAKGAGDGGVPITSLSDRGQAALIAETKGKPPVTLKGKDDGGVSRVVVHGTVKRSIVVAVRPDDFLAPGDRIDALRISIAVVPHQKDEWGLAAWSQASNGVTVLDVGKLTSSTTSKLTGETGLKLDHALPDTKIGAEVDRSNSQEFDIKDVTEFNAAVDNEGVAWLDETAGWRENLDHNLAIDVTLAASPNHLRSTVFVRASALTKDDPKAPGKSVPVAPSDVSLTEIHVASPDNALEPICGLAKMDYRIRHITDANASATFTESDDLIENTRGHSDAYFLLAPPPLEPGYGLFIGDAVVSFEIRPGHPAGLRFQTLAEALEFADWLNLSPPADGKLGNARIGLLKGPEVQPMTTAQVRQLLAGALDGPEIRQSQENLLRGCPRPPPAPAAVAAPRP